MGCCFLVFEILSTSRYYFTEPLLYQQLLIHKTFQADDILAYLPQATLTLACGYENSAFQAEFSIFQPVISIEYNIRLV
jgi:hypothetical protein